eukprot:598338-Pleurochrysis_carterae.AAC.1
MQPIEKGWTRVGGEVRRHVVDLGGLVDRPCLEARCVEERLSRSSPFRCAPPAIWLEFPRRRSLSVAVERPIG